MKFFVYKFLRAVDLVYLPCLSCFLAFVFPGLVCCLFCGKSFSRPDVLKTHIRDLHENAGCTFACDICAKPAKSLNALKVHMSLYHRKSADKTAYN